MLGLIGALIPMISTAVDRFLPEDPVKAQELKATLQQTILTNASELEKAQGRIVEAEANGESWLQRNWRPMVMLFFSTLVGAYWFGYTPDNLSPDSIDKLFQLVQIGMGGYIIGRSGEKIAKSLDLSGKK